MSANSAVGGGQRRPPVWRRSDEVVTNPVLCPRRLAASSRFPFLPVVPHADHPVANLESGRHGARRGGRSGNGVAEYVVTCAGGSSKPEKPAAHGNARRLRRVEPHAVADERITLSAGCQWWFMIGWKAARAACQKPTSKQPPAAPARRDEPAREKYHSSPSRLCCALWVREPVSLLHSMSPERPFSIHSLIKSNNYR